MLRNRNRNKNSLVNRMMRKGFFFSALVTLLVATMASVGVVEAAGADEGKIAFVSFGTWDNSFIHIINPDGTNEVRLTEGERPLWSPDGKRIAYIFKGEFYKGELYVINVDGTNKIKLAKPTRFRIEEYDWLPDGKKIVFSEGNRGHYPGDGSIFIVNADGNNLVKLVECQKEKGESMPSFFITPDGKIVYEYAKRVSRGGRSTDVGVRYIMDADGTDKTELTTEEYPRIHGRSPDGKKIAYYDDSSLWIMNPDGTGKTIIVESGRLYGSIFSWSPDGEKIVYGDRKSCKDKGIYIVNVDGSGLTKLAYGTYPQWSPVSFVKPIPTPTPKPTITPTLEPTEDAFNYNGEYTLDQAKLKEEEKKVLPYVMKYAKEYKVSPCLIMAVIRQESDFFDYSQDPDKDRDKFDIGYMQVSHIAAIDTYKGYTGDEYTGTKEEWQKDGLDPNTNIKYGTRYLRIQYNRIKDHAVHYEDVYDDLLESTVSAYNAGHPTKDNEKYVEGVIQGRDLVEGQRRGYEFFLTIRVPIGGMPTPEEGVPGFEAIFAIVGLLAVAYLLGRRK